MDSSVVVNLQFGKIMSSQGMLGVVNDDDVVTTTAGLRAAFEHYMLHIHCRLSRW